jgi:AAA domain
VSDSKLPTLEEEREARRGLAALALSTDPTVYEALIAGLEVPRHRLDADVLARIGEPLDGEPLGMTDGLALQIEMTRPVGDGDDVRPVAQIVSVEEFVAIEEPGAGAILGTEDNAVMPPSGDVMLYGDGGVGKTTLAADLGFHLAAGDDWLGIPVARPVRVLMIENEGPRPLFRRKLDRKLRAWTGSPVEDRLLILEEPWGRFTFDSEPWRELLARTARGREVDVVITGPLTAAGMEAAGTLQEVRAFLDLVDEVRALAGRRFANLLIHHENRGGQVSGAWEGAGDTLLHLQQHGRGQLRLYVQKARWSSEHHATSRHLVWADGEGFTVEEKPELDDEAIAEKIVAAVTAEPGVRWTRVEEQTPGMAKERRRAVRDGLLRAGKIVNLAKDETGELVALNRCPERKPARLYLGADPAIRHLRPDPGADEAQSAPPGGERQPNRLRPAPRLKEGAGAQAQILTPQIALGGDSYLDNTDAAEDAAERRTT